MSEWLGGKWCVVIDVTLIVLEGLNSCFGLLHCCCLAVATGRYYLSVCMHMLTATSWTYKHRLKARLQWHCMSKLWLAHKTISDSIKSVLVLFEWGSVCSQAELQRCLLYKSAHGLGMSCSWLELKLMVVCGTWLSGGCVLAFSNSTAPG